MKKPVRFFVPKLKGRENYDDWAFAIENFLTLEGLSNTLDGSEKNSSQVAKAKPKLVFILDTSLYVHIQEAKAAKELRNKLKSIQGVP